MDAKTNGALRAHPMPGVYDASRDQIGPVDNYYDAGGLTKRELFAAMAMQGICAHTDTWGETTDGIAIQAIRVADALLAELAKAAP